MENKESGVVLPHNIVQTNQQLLVFMCRSDGGRGQWERIQYTGTFEQVGVQAL